MESAGDPFMAVVIWLPALSIGCLVAGVVAHGRLPLWLVVVSLLAPLGELGFQIRDIRTYVVHGRDLDCWLAATSDWASVVSGLLILGYVADKRRRGSGRALSLVGLTVSALPLVPVLLFALAVWTSGPGGD
jgi:hypothetical protein